MAAQPAEQHMAPTSVPLLISFQHAADLLGAVSVRHIERLAKARKLRRVGAGRARRIVYSSLLAYIEREGSRG
jgi:excisionase family DNA binding protein